MPVNFFDVKTIQDNFSLLKMAVIILLASLAGCTLGTSSIESGPLPVLSRSVANDSVVGRPDVDENRAAAKLVHLPFTISLQRHFLVKDPVFERSGYASVEHEIVQAIQDWAEDDNYQFVLLPSADSKYRFASERLTNTSVRLLNRKRTINDVPLLADLATFLDETLGDSRDDSLEGTTESQHQTLFIAGTYHGHLKSGSQLFKEHLSSNLRYVRGLGRKRLERPVRGFGKLYVVLLDGHTGRILWYGNSGAAPHEVGNVMRLMLSQL